MKNTRSGGRCLDAILLNSNLTSTQKLVLIVFSSELNFKGDFLEERYLTHERWAKKTSYKKRMVIYAINELEEKGYLSVRRKSHNGQKLPHTMYSLTEKLFDEYANLDSATDAPIDQTDSAPSAHVKIDSATGAPCDSARVAPIDQTDGATGALHNSFMIQTPSNKTPTVCDYAGARVYDPPDEESHTHNQVNIDIDEKTKATAEKIISTYFTNVADNNVFVSKQSQVETMSEIIKAHGSYAVKKTILDIFQQRDFKRIDWQIDSVVRAIKAGQ